MWICPSGHGHIQATGRDARGRKVYRYHPLETTLVRVGNEEYVRENRSDGLTTPRARHVRIRRDTVRFVFRGESGVEHDVGIAARRVAAVLRRCCQDLPGQRLLRYLDANGVRHGITSTDINDYLREASRRR